MDSVLSGMDEVLYLLDDELVATQDKETHIIKLKAVLQRLQDAGLTLQRDKYVFFKTQVIYRGYVIDNDGLKKSPQKVKAILDAPIPTDVNKLQSFLGLAN